MKLTVFHHLGSNNQAYHYHNATYYWHIQFHNDTATTNQSSNVDDHT